MPSGNNNSSLIDSGAKIFEWIRDHSGNPFDPRVIETCLSIIQQE